MVILKPRAYPESLFQTWRTFLFAENVETLDIYKTRIRQCAVFLGYGETTATRIGHLCYYGPKTNYRCCKRVMTKGKCDKQFGGEPSSITFRSVKDDQSNSSSHSPHNADSYRQVTFYRYGELDQKIDKLSNMMSKVATHNTSSPSNKPYKLYIYQRR